ncbi:MAG: helix-turn-helix transcriptional regulator [Candidatus Omnitrophica bacterium]|nr:helix-turn-helix transcriptional regulator [Candidatus Omnitrophota bacterium]
MTDRQIATKLKDYINRNNLRQWEFAKKINVPERTLSRWLSGKTKVSRAYLRILQKEGII